MTTKPRTKQIARTYDQMRALWSRYGSSTFGTCCPSDEEEIACMIRGKFATKMQNFIHYDGAGDEIARITRFWFVDGTTDDLIFTFRWDDSTYVLSDW